MLRLTKVLLAPFLFICFPFVVLGKQKSDVISNNSSLSSALAYFDQNTEDPRISTVVIKNLISSVVASTNKKQLNSPVFSQNIDVYKNRSFRPYVEKINLPKKATVYFWGDLHGELHSLSFMLTEMKKNGIIDDQFNILKKNTYFIFLGDVVDRGNDGIELIYLISRLMEANPQNIHWVRGNHEDISLNLHFGFCHEISKKYKKDSEEVLASIAKLYEALPVALFLGHPNKNNKDIDSISYTLCVHGGLELGYDPRSFLASDETCDWCIQLNRTLMKNKLDSSCKKALDSTFNLYPQKLRKIIFTSSTSPTTLGFMWSDFEVDYNSSIVRFNPNRGWIYGQLLTENVLNVWSTPTHKVTNIMRAHQHHGTMLSMLIKNKGLVSLWDDLVYTVLSAPVSGLGFNNYSFVEKKYDVNNTSIKLHTFKKKV